MRQQGGVVSITKPSAYLVRTSTNKSLVKKIFDFTRKKNSYPPPPVIIFLHEKKIYRVFSLNKPKTTFLMPIPTIQHHFSLLLPHNVMLNVIRFE